MAPLFEAEAVEKEKMRKQKQKRLFRLKKKPPCRAGTDSRKILVCRKTLLSYKNAEPGVSTNIPKRSPQRRSSPKTTSIS